ncbi:cofilin/actin-depolymerizing factor homolog-related [Anaeramoeba flamelloides]|uniref:Cofilin/actin-depolymerizing factor homolog-related n=1 Tax=Anaeramoeba flamelloides TaxID=1746091 RepID=A0ABQ8YFX7_9EUKA|nr:cofilin/actin-depolymerizing factor homolog-related [Anaeramoeba flamelloides]
MGSLNKKFYINRFGKKVKKGRKSENEFIIGNITENEKTEISKSKSEYKILNGSVLKGDEIYAIYKINDNINEFEIERIGTKKETFEDFKAHLPVSSCRAVLYLYELNYNSLQIKKLCFISWCPDRARIRDKMIFASIRNNFVKSCQEIDLSISASSPIELNQETIQQKIIYSLNH